MKRLKRIEVLLFVIGFICGVLINFRYSRGKKISFDKNLQIFKYNSTLAEKLFDEIKIVCLVLTQPKYHEIRAEEVKRTWGKKCNKLIFLSSKADNKLGSIGVSYEENRQILWEKVRNGFLYAFENFYDEFDWFLKADDDS